MTNIEKEQFEEKSCHCGCEQHSHSEACHCDDNQHGEHSCGCSEGCTCGDDCHCHEGDRCCDECTCEHANEKECECGENCHCHQQEETLDDKAQMYLGLAKQIQADFDNYRRHAVEDKNKARVIGQISVIEAFLPALDTFKEAKKSIVDENVLKGVEMIEQKIFDALHSLGVKKIETIGHKFDHNLHEAIAQFTDENQEDDIILDEYQAGYIFNEKVIRYAKVIVNRKGN
ncbi:MAG: nucleotide exchange factor GrpE [Clostridia bacterium]|nr:nucleotide exchange factor GrpE [Clostridia bacterium]